MKRMNYYFLFFPFLFAINMMVAQTKTVTGTVTDDKNSPLPGVSILVKGTNTGTQSDFDGSYSIEATSSDVLVFSYVGFKTKEVSTGILSSIDVSLETDLLQLDAVVVVGYGTSLKSDLTGAVSSVGPRDFEKQPIFRVEDALQGRASGVQVSKNSGAPGADVKIRVRGANSINGSNQPLIVIDGVIGADLKLLNTNDIASMEILKDASATAIYGSRGANGVVLVTTKRGQGEPTITVDAFTSVSSISKKLDLLSPQEFATINNVDVMDGGADYQDEFFTTGYTTNLQLSISGKENKVGYFVSGNVLDQSGTTINSDYTRYSLRSNLDLEFNDNLSVQLNINGVHDQSLNIISGGIRSSPDARGGIVGIVGWDPTIPVKDSDGNYNFLGGGSSLINPIAQRLESEDYFTTPAVHTNLNLSYDITPNLNLTVFGGLIYRGRIRERYNGVPAGTALGNITGASGGGSANHLTTIQNSNILTWTKSFNLHNLKVTGLFENQKSVSKSITANGGEFSLPANFYSLNLGTQPRVNSNLSKFHIQSYMGRADYNFDRKLYLTGTIRTDISSRFRSGNRVGVFPSGAVAYQFRDLFNNRIQSLKIRAGYGEVGNQAIPPFSTFSTLSTGSNYPLNGTTESSGIGLTGGNLGNPDLTWETTKQTNIGLDATFFNGKASLSLNKYWKNTVDLLLDVPISDFLGGGTITQNIGEVFNGGWEVDFNITPIKIDDFDWNINANYSFNESEVKSLSNGVDELFIFPVGNISNTTGAYVQVKVGAPLGQFFGATALGAYQIGDLGGTPGDARYLHDNDGIVLDVIGNGVPKHTWAINNTFVFGKFDLNFLLRGVHGFDVMNFTRGKVSLSGGIQGGPTYGEYRNRWTPENQTNIPAGGDLFVNSTRFIEKGDFIRLSNLALGYNIDARGFINTIRIYASAQNLLTISDYEGYDPEASSTNVSSGTASSIDYGANPNTRNFTFGLNVTF